MNVIKAIAVFIGQLALAILGPVLLVAAGALIMGLGVYLNWQWVVYGGMIVAALGVMLIIRFWQMGD